MKTQILHLESYDDLHSIKDKLNWGQGERVILVWPLRGRPLNNKLDLLMVKRHTQALGAKLALVTRKHRVREYAGELDIPVFRSLRQANTLPWEYTIKEAPPTKFPKVREKSLRDMRELAYPGLKTSWVSRPVPRILFFSLGAIACLAILIFLLPSAEIHLSPSTKSQELTLSISANPTITSYNLSGAIPALNVSVVVEGRDSLRTSGEIGIPQQTASGEVIFTNLTDQPITIPQGTIVRTLDSTPIRFATMTESEIPSEAGAIVAVPIEALNPGPAGNLLPDSLVVIEGNLALSLTATNPEPTTGGGEHISSAPSAEDYDTLSTRLLAALWETALEEAEALLAANDIILDSTPRMVTVLEKMYTPEEPQPSSELSLLLRVEFEVLVVIGQTLEEMVSAILDATLPEGYSSFEGTLTIIPLTVPEFQEDNTIQWDVQAQRDIYTSEGQIEVVRRILGMTPLKASKFLSENLSLKSPVEIQISPPWWPRMPLLEIRILILEEG
jgi:hypothetical protein